MSIESRIPQYENVFGQWHIEKMLGTGSGGKSAVFSIYRDNNGWREYSALKVVCLMQEQGTQEELSAIRQGEYSTAVREQKNQADQEVRLMEQLRGKTNIVDYQDHAFHSWHDETGFGVDLLIRMEKLTDLRNRIRTGKAFTQDEIIRVGRDICQALVICHSKNILHRDIKPENIFFNEDGDYKLGDFGISRILDNNQAMASTGVGTLPYLAPEQASGQYDERVDIYSLGLVLYELANGNRLPFADSGYIRESHIRRRLSGQPLPPLRNVSQTLNAVILTACAFRPGDRFQSARAMLSALESAARELAHAPLQQPASYGTIPASTLSNPVSHSSQGAAYHTTPAVNASGGSRNNVPRYNPAVAQAGSSTTSRKNSGEPERKPRKLLLPILLLVFALTAGAVAFLYLNRDTENSGQVQNPTQTQPSANTQSPQQTVPPTPVETQVPVSEEAQAPALDVTISVTDAECVTMPNRYDSADIWCFHIPQITLSTANTDAINRKIYNDLEDISQNPYTYIGLNYTWGRKGNLVTVLAESSYLNNGARGYYIYNISAETGKEITDSELLKAFGMNQNDFHQMVRQRLSDYWDEEEWLIEHIGQEYYDELVEKTLADSNVSQCEPYINSRGQLAFTASVFSPAGSETSLRLFNASGTMFDTVPECTQYHNVQVVETEPPAQVSGTPLIELKPTSVTGTLYLNLTPGTDYDVSYHRNSPFTVFVDYPVVLDCFGGTYDFSIHVDGNGTAERSITYNLNGEYTTFRCYIVFLEFADNPNNDKPIEIHCDGVCVGAWNMASYIEPIFFEIDVTNIRTLKIVYPNSGGSNDQAAICDAFLE